jgi:protein arginine kinase activator
MICGACGRRPAAVLIKTIINNKVSEQALCPACSGQSSLEGGAEAMLMKLLSRGGVRRKARAAVPRCRCGIRYADFEKAGRFGCPACYETFAVQIAALLPRVHGGKSRHKGKSPRRTRP